jgi:hypothetical protein
MNSSKTRSVQPTDFENEFHLLLGRLVHAHARFDFGVGLQLNWLGSHCAVDVSKHLDPRRTSFSTRLQRLRKLVLVAFAPGGEILLSEFKAWFKRAEAATALRNGYVHGRWGVPGRLRFTETTTIADATPLLCFLPMSWNMSPGCDDLVIELTMDEFASQVNELKATFVEYFILCNENLRSVAPRANLEKI